MTRPEQNKALIQRICCNDESAMDFLVNCWSPYVHEVDDIMDGDRPDKRDQLKTFAKAIAVYTHPFFLKNLFALRAVATLVTVNYADVVEWEKSSDEWKAQWADHYRHCAMDMVIAVAHICGGYEHAFNISQEQRAICWQDHHHPKTGAPC